MRSRKRTSNEPKVANESISAPKWLIVAVLAALGTSAGGAATGQWRISELEKKVEEHNNVRLQVVEMKVKVDDMAEDVKEIKVDLKTLAPRSRR